MDFSVRRAEPADLTSLTSFTVREAREAEDRALERERVQEGIRRALEDDSIARYWVVVKGDSVVGSLSVVREWSDWKAGFYWWLQSVFILPEYRGRGLMTRLVDTVLEAARQEAVPEIRLYVHSNNQRAVRAYRKSGFSDTSYRIMRMKI